jgi:hypothetical protein
VLLVAIFAFMTAVSSMFDLAEEQVLWLDAVAITQLMTGAHCASQENTENKLITDEAMLIRLGSRGRKNFDACISRG